MSRLIPGHRRHRWTKEVAGCGLYPGPRQHHRCNKTVYGNAVWQSFVTAAHWCNSPYNPAASMAEKLRQDDYVHRIDEESLTE